MTNNAGEDPRNSLKTLQIPFPEYDLQDILQNTNQAARAWL